MRQPLAHPNNLHLLDALVGFLEQSKRLFVLTGAGCSTDSGIPDYRNSDGEWKHKRPVQYQDFVCKGEVRKRYWARSLLGWKRIALAQPNPAHFALASLEAAGRIHQLVTQNVDGLHQKAGSRRVIDLHGRLDTVECLGCHRQFSRESFQQSLEDCNPKFKAFAAASAPDGDVLLEGVNFNHFHVPSCRRCGGILKPRVVFFGEGVPLNIVNKAYACLKEADALLVVGSSLMVYSGYRFCRTAWEQNKPIAAINLGRTRADAQFSLKIPAPCSQVLPALCGYVENFKG
jgi:NAD-dependent SIR2 family protein deacetylase